MKLRPYQEEAIQKVVKEAKNRSKHLLVLPTGSGKTVVFANIVKKLNLKTLVIAHTTELVDQSNKTLARLGVLDFQVTSVQSACRDKRLKELKEERFDFLIIDECHRTHSSSYLKIINFLSPRHLLGVTATPFRSDKKRLEEIFGETSYSVPLLDLINEGYLCDFEGYQIKTNAVLKGISTARGDFIAAKLAPVVNVKSRNLIIVDEFLKISPHEKAICFCVDVKHSEDLKSEFVSRGISCEAVHGLLSDKKRSSIIRDFNSGKIQVVTNCQVLTEGFDEPSVSSLIMARPTCSKVLYMQMIGRGCRIFPGKDVCKVIEFTDNDFDVCFLQDIVDKRVNGGKFKNGERLSSFSLRMKKELGESTGEIFVDKKVIIPKSIYERHASKWQISELNRAGISYDLPLTEFMANHLLTKGV